MKVPRGFRLLTRLSPFTSLIGPLYVRARAGAELSIGLHIEEKHTNIRGNCHGGVLASLADLCLGYAMHHKLGTRGAYVTANLTVDYAGAARVGDWVESQVDIQRIGTRLAFANCYLVVGERRIVRASGIFARADRQEARPPAKE